MATIKEEFETLKLRIGKRQGKARITVIDHAAKSSQTCLVEEGFQLLRRRIEKGEQNEVIHIVDHAAERERKEKNPDKSTRAIVNCHTPELWSRFQMSKERFMVIAVDPALAVELMTRALDSVPNDVIRQWLSEGPKEPGAGPAPPKAEIPGWLE